MAPMRRSGVVVANGRPPTKRLLQDLRRQTNILVCADGGANAVARANIRPDLIIGDLDSVTPETVRMFRSVPSRRIAEQNSTDLEKALRWLLQRGVRDITVVGATGGRLDHVAGNLHVIGKYATRANLRIVEERGELLPIGRGREFSYATGTTVSLIPLSTCLGVTTHGLRWELRNATLKLGVRDGTSNSVVSTPFRIRVRRGTLLLYYLFLTKGARAR